MTLKELIDLTKDNPEILDYTICLSEFFCGDQDGDDMTVVSDCPFSGIAVNEEEQELKFIMSKSNYHAFEVSQDKILRLFRKDEKSR